MVLAVGIIIYRSMVVCLFDTSGDVVAPPSGTPTAEAQFERNIIHFNEWEWKCHWKWEWEWKRGKFKMEIYFVFVERVMEDYFKSEKVKRCDAIPSGMVHD